MPFYLTRARLPEPLNLAPVKQKTKELRLIQADDLGFLQLKLLLALHEEDKMFTELVSYAKAQIYSAIHLTQIP